jgi:hypothetical protein
MRKYLPLTLVLACLALAFAIYYPGTSGYFTFDDTANIVNNTALHLQQLTFTNLKRAAFSGEAGMLGRPISMVSFALNYYFGGLNAFNFKLTNIIIHLLNGICVYILTLLLLDTDRQQTSNAPDLASTRWISLAVAAAWMLHPLNLTGVLYVVQRMTSLAALFTFLGLIAYVHGRRKVMEHKSGWIWVFSSFFLFTPLALFSKENGALLPAFILLAEVTFFRFQVPSQTTKRLLIALFVLTVALPCAILIIFNVTHPAWVSGGYIIRDFTLPERVMTETRIIWFYIRLIFAPDISQMGMYHDDIMISKDLLSPISTLFAMAGLILLGIGALLSIRRYSIASFGILFFCIGHSLESSVLPLELVHEHRNYLPDYGLLLALFYYLLDSLRHNQSLSLRRGLAIMFIFVLAAITYVRAAQWGDPVAMKEKASIYHPNSIRSNIDIGNFYAALPAGSQTEAEDYYRRAYEYFVKAAELSPSDTLGLFGLIALNSHRGMPVEESWVRALAGRIKHSPFSASTAASLASLQQCVTAASCKIAPESMESLIMAALQNPTLQQNSKVKILFTWSDFLFSLKHDSAAAAAAAHQAVEVKPNDMEVRNTLINFLINMNQLDEAKMAILQAHKFDKSQLDSETLDVLEQRRLQLNDMQIKAKRGTNP